MSEKQTGWLQFITAIAALGLQIWSAIHGTHIDPSGAAVAVGVGASGIHHLSK